MRSDDVLDTIFIYSLLQRPQYVYHYLQKHIVRWTSRAMGGPQTRIDPNKRATIIKRAMGDPQTRILISIRVDYVHPYKGNLTNGKVPLVESVHRGCGLGVVTEVC